MASVLNRSEMPHHIEAEVEDEGDTTDSEFDEIKLVRQHQTEKNAFQQWITENSDALYAAEVTQSPEYRNTNVKEDFRTLDELLDEDYWRKNTSVREYQFELFERAKLENTIAVLDTGAGKTLIAALFIDHVLQQELIDRASGRDPKVAFFVVEKVVLVVQQFHYLKANLDHPIAQAHGHINDNLWTQDFWTHTFQENRLIVCTADVLLQCLMHSFLQMKDINLLVFDEVHHAKDDHPFAHIMREFYEPTKNDSVRPRVFSMTASPDDSGTLRELELNIRALERTMNSKIATIVEEGELRGFVPRAVEENVQFKPGTPGQDTQLFMELETSFGSLKEFKKLLGTAKVANRELGPWCSDAYWTFSLSESILEKTERLELCANETNGARRKSPEAILEELGHLKAAKEKISQLEKSLSEPEPNQLSDKVSTLKVLLNKLFCAPSRVRCLVFVERRSTARLLHILFELIGSKWLRSGYLVGCRAQTQDGFNDTFRSQLLTIKDFRDGRINCLFSTSVAEEGLDVPECNYVIRFDPCLSTIKYIQSLGRARSQASKVLHFIAKNSADEEELERLRHSMHLMKQYCGNLPQDRRLGDLDENFAIYSKNEQREETKVLDSGAKLTYAFALPILSYFCALLPKSEDGTEASPTFIQRMEGNKFRYEVILPSRSPLTSALGPSRSRKSTAKQAAAYRACVLLLRDGHLSDQLIPTYTKLLPALRSAKLALTNNESKQYPAKMKPDLWNVSQGESTNHLSIAILDLSSDWEKPVQPLALLTRREIPQLPDFPLYKTNGETSSLKICTIDQYLDVNEENLDMFTHFTLRIFRDVFNKQFEKNLEQMSWWLVPLDLHAKCHMSIDSPNPSALIDWDLLREVALSEPLKWSPSMENQTLLDKFFINPFTGALRFLSFGIARDSSPFDKVSETLTDKQASRDIVSWSSGLFKQSALRRTWDETQPVLTAEIISHRMDYLSPAKQDQKGHTSCLICPEPLLISRIPPKLVNMCLLIPSTIHAVESSLIALEFANKVGIRVRPEYALEATTKDSSRTDQLDIVKHGVIPSRVGANYERLEFLGDCFLKLATSLATFVHDKDENEFSMHCNRMAMLCNKNLFENSTKHEYFKYIRARSLERHSWYPEGLQLLAGKGAKNWQKFPKHTQPLSDKTIADVSEAMIGAALMSHYEPGAWSFTMFDEPVKAVTAFASNEIYVQHNEFNEWNGYRAAYVEPKYQLAKGNAVWMELVRQLEEEAGYRFRYPGLAQSAFSHPSRPYIWSNVPSYQRLEFLGDALLDLVAVMFLFLRFPTADEHWLTEHKMAIVSNKFLGALSVKLGFHRHLRHSQQSLEKQIRNYAMEVEEAAEAGAENRSYWTTVGDPPKCLSDIVEAYIAARFIDSGFDYGEVQNFFDDHIKWFFEDKELYDGFANDHPVARYSHLMRQTFGCTRHRVFCEEIVADDRKVKRVVAAVVIHGKVIASGQAASTREAKSRAADQALKALLDLNTHEFRHGYNCTCGTDPKPNT